MQEQADAAAIQDEDERALAEAIQLGGLEEDVVTEQSNPSTPITGFTATPAAVEAGATNERPTRGRKRKAS